jgi:hypothetical protein
MRGTNDETENKERRMPEQVQPMALTPEDAPAIVLLERFITPIFPIGDGQIGAPPRGDRPVNSRSAVK